MISGQTQAKLKMLHVQLLRFFYAMKIGTRTSAQRLLPTLWFRMMSAVQDGSAQTGRYFDFYNFFF